MLNKKRPHTGLHSKFHADTRADAAATSHAQKQHTEIPTLEPEKEEGHERDKTTLGYTALHAMRYTA